MPHKPNVQGWNIDSGRRRTQLTKSQNPSLKSGKENLQLVIDFERRMAMDSVPL